MLSRAAIHHERAQQAATTTVACAVDPDGGCDVWLSARQQHEIVMPFVLLRWTVGTYGEICCVDVVARATGDTTQPRSAWMADQLPVMVDYSERFESELRATWRKR